MTDRRTAERLSIPPDRMEYISIEEIPEPESVDRVSLRETPPDETEREERTEPMRLPFIALLAERDPLVQARLTLRRTLALKAERSDDDDRPTDPMLPGKTPG